MSPRNYIIGLGCTAVLAFIFLILSGAIGGKTYWGFFVLFPYILIPVMGLITANADPSSTLCHFGCFFESFLWVSSIMIPIVLLHVDAIDGSQFGWIISSCILFTISFFGIAKISAE